MSHIFPSRYDISLLIYAGGNLGFPSGCQFADGIAGGGKFLFVFCHDISLVHLAVVMKVISQGRQIEQGGRLDLLYGKVKEGAVVSLEFHGSAGCQYLVIYGKKFR